jgi:hypothetical protein
VPSLFGLFAFGFGELRLVCDENFQGIDRPLPFLVHRMEKVSRPAQSIAAAMT